MFIDDNNIQRIRRLVKELKVYVEMQKEYTRLELTETLTILFSTLIFAIVLILSGLMVLFYLSLSLAYLLEPYVGGLPVSYAIIAGIFLLFVVVVIIFRKRLIINPIANLLANLFLSNHSK
ncbi:MAG: phage holin family protein [Mediterranea sp.]|jgi:hypothetical protein|nr:phage holin family protein [Mediterranea sp.]